MEQNERDTCYEDLQYIVSVLGDDRGKTFGSLLKIDREIDFERLRRFVHDFAQEQIEIDDTDFVNQTVYFDELIDITEMLAQKYDVVVTNPPYAGGRNINTSLLEYLSREFSDSKNDMFSAFIERCGELTKPNCYQAMITMHSWMFLSSFERLRNKLLRWDIVNIAHLGARAFEDISGEVVQTASFVLRNSNVSNYLSTFVRLVDYLSQQLKEDAFLKGLGIFRSHKELFSKVPGSPFAYWLTDKSVAIFENGKQLEVVANPRQGMKTLDNDYYIHFWYEVDFSRSYYDATSLEEAQSSGKVWFPINHGGESRKYYGNNSEVVKWYNDGSEMKAQAVKTYGTVTRTITNIAYYFKEGVTWSVITSTPSFRRYYKGHLFSNSGQSIVPENPEMLDYLTGLLNSKISTFVLQILSPTLGFESGYLKKIPIIVDSKRKAIVESITTSNISLSRTDWDSFETSWDFKRHPLIQFRQSNALWGDPTAEDFRNNGSIQLSYKAWETFTEMQFSQLKSNEEELNRIFIDIYGLQDELTPEVEDKDVTIRKADLGRDIRSFISYAVGCMFGRYSIYTEGLLYAGGGSGHFSNLVEKIQDHLHAKGLSMFPENEFYPENDNILPIGSADYFEDDIVVQFVKFVRTVYGNDTLSENLNFIADALYPSGNGSAQEKIRRYFLNDFYKDHLKIYQKRPIYWLLDSGKKDGFKALFYLHRYDKYTIARVRTDYLHPLQRKYEAEIKRYEVLATTTDNARDKAAYRKEIDALQAKIDECRTYDQVVSHIAHQQIELDLDDGVKVNYEKFQGVEVPKDNGKTEKMDLLAKI